MALPMILSLLGSGLAGSGALAGLGVLSSPLVAGALGAGVGSAIETGDIGEGIKTGLTAGALGALGGAIAGGGAAAPTGAPSPTPPAGAEGIRGMIQNMPKGISPVAAPAEGFSFGADALNRGVNQGILSGAGIGTAIPGTLQALSAPTMEIPEAEDIPQAMPANRRMFVPGRQYRPGYDPEAIYFDPRPMPSRFAGGGMIRYQPVGMQPRYMQAGGIADAMPGAQMMPEMNDKDVVQNAIRAVKGELPEQEAAIVLGMFLEQYGEEALRRLVSDVRSGKADGERGDVEGMVEGPGDGMDDFVPAGMDDGSQDVLLSDGEFVVPADVVSGLGNGSTDAGAEELYNMMDRVREERTGTTEQPDQVKVGGLLPA